MKSYLLRPIAFLLCLTLAISCGEDEDQTPPCTVGEACNDGDNTTTNDMLNSDCDCVGTATACTGIGDADGDGVCTDLDCDDSDDQIVTSVGASCDDGNADTENDMIDNNCDCVGTCTISGDPCDDGNANTFNDIYNADCECEGTAYGTLTDTRDNQMYQTVDIGTQTWMAENLNYDAGVSWCYANAQVNCDVYGRLYNWETATQACPTGWHLPSDADWDALLTELGGQNIAGGKLKEAGTADWNAPNTGATNSSGFTALPGGFRLVGTGEFQNIRANGTWWSSAEDMALAAWHRNMLFGGEAVTRGSSFRGDGFSVRCIQD